MYSLDKIGEFKLGKKTVFMVQNAFAGKGNFLHFTEAGTKKTHLFHHFYYVFLILPCFINGQVF